MNIIRQAIVTKYFGPGVKGSRIKATAYAGSITVPYDAALNVERNHAKAALALANKYRWAGHWFGGGLPNQGYVWTCVDHDDQTAAFVISKEG